jgi:hypothetical protein
VAAARKAQSEPVFPVSNLPAQPAICTMQGLFTLHATPKCHFSRAGGFPKAPATAPPCVFRSPGLFSACSRPHGTQEARLLCGVLPAISTFQRHSTHHPSIVGHFPVPSCYCKRSRPFSCVQRTGCGACGLGYPHQVWWAPPVYIARAWSR